MNSVKFLMICLLIFSSLNFQSSLSVAFQSNSKSNSIKAANSDNNTIPTNINLPYTISNPATLRLISLGYFTNSSSSFIVEIHSNNLYFRYGTNYSIFFTYHSVYNSLKYFPISNDSNAYGLIIAYNTVDHQPKNKYVNNTFNIVLVGSHGVIASYTAFDDILGTNILGGALIGSFDKNIPGLQVIISYIELYTDQNNNIHTFTHIMLLNLHNLSLIRTTYLNSGIFINNGYYFKNIVNSDVIPSVETNFATNLSRINLFSNSNFSTSVFSTEWFPIGHSAIQMKTIFDYNSNSYLLYKTNLNINSTIALLKFQPNFSQYLSKVSEPYDIQSENSSIIIRVLSNNTLCYLIQFKNESIWKFFNNTILTTEQLPDQTSWVYKGLLYYNNDNISDIFILSYKNGYLSNFIIQDGSNLSNLLTNFSVINLSESSFYNYILIGNFKSITNTSLFQEEQILFVYKNNYYQLLNNGTTDNILMFLSPRDGSTINYCSNIFYTLSWNINRGNITSTTIYTKNFTYVIQGKQNLTLLMESGNSNIIVTQYYFIEIITNKGLPVYDYISINFRPNQCSVYSLPVISKNITQNYFQGKQIPDLAIIISFVFILTIGALALIYYKDHKKID